MEFIGPLFGDLGERAFFFLGLTDGAVVNIGQVADVVYFVAAELELEQPTDDVVDDEGAKVADVRGRIDGRAAIIEADHAVGVRRCDRFEAAVEGIVKLKGHIRRIGKEGVNGIPTERNVLFIGRWTDGFRLTARAGAGGCGQQPQPVVCAKTERTKEVEKLMAGRRMA